MVFDSQWFRENQNLLLAFVNTRIGKDILCIDSNKSSLSNEKIIEIMPNYIKSRVGENQFVSEFRTRNKFANRLYYSFKELWEFIHWYDIHIANRYMPILNLGFDTLTAYPNAPTETVSIDGLIYTESASTTWATLHDAANGTLVLNSNTVQTRLVSAGTTDRWSYIYRGFATFDTSSIPDTNSILSASIDVYGQAKTDPANWGTLLNVYSSTQTNANALVVGDYSRVGTTPFSTSINQTNFSTSSYNSYSLNANGLNNINKSGASKFSFRDVNYDVGNVAPTWSANKTQYFSFFAANWTGTTQDPKLTVEHSAPVTFIANTIII